MTADRTEGEIAPTIKVSMEPSPGQRTSLEFRRTFRIGRVRECEIYIENEFVSRVHAEVVFENRRWVVRDLGSSNGIFVGANRVESVAVEDTASIRLGVCGPEVLLEVEKVRPAPPLTGSQTMLAHYVDHYFGKTSAAEAVGQHTQYVRQAFAQVQTKQKRKFGKIIVVLLVAVAGALGYGLYEHRQNQHQKEVAKELFYSMKSLDLELANLERIVADTHNQVGVQEIRKFQDRRHEIQKNYDHFLSTLHVYDPKMTEQRRLMLRVARVFGECELDMPADFESEVNRYIKKWQSSPRFSKAVQTAQQNGYTTSIPQELLTQGLPPQYFYLAMQESNFDRYATGPMTRKGYAKGMWQFIPETAVKYGLHLGPLVDLSRADPGDERDHYDKATQAAAKYLKDLYSTDAQASGLLVIACYNWGENQMLPLVRSMPENPRERNFWRLLSQHRKKIPQETYDYVFYIISAAVIGENPRLFGFNFDNPLAGAGTPLAAN